MTNKLYQFDLHNCRLLSVVMEVNEEFAPKTQADIAINLALNHTYHDSDNTLHLIMELSVAGQDDFMTISIRYGGIFKFASKPELEEHMTKTAEITCAAILFPFVRETVADLTRRAGFPPLLLKTVNFVDFYNNNHKERRKKEDAASAV